VTALPVSLTRSGTADPPPPDPGMAAAERARRRLEMALGVLWLADGALQFQPYMFSRAFFASLLGMANMGLPGPLSATVYHVTSLLTAHPVAWNAVFASLQVALGAGLLWRRTAPLARSVSIAWALGVWVIGEGLGGLLMPGVSALNGAPGAALLYAVAAVVVWPRRSGSASAPADAGLLGARGASWCWAALWTGLALLELGGANHAAGVPAAEVGDIGAGEPRWLAALNQHAGQLLAGHGAAFALVAGLIQLGVGLCVLRPRWRRAALAAGMAIAISYGVFGQDLGGLLTGQATDPGTAPLLVLIALALWPQRRPESPSCTPTGRMIT
jgi:hypothetical protein